MSEFSRTVQSSKFRVQSVSAVMEHGGTPFPRIMSIAFAALFMTGFKSALFAAETPSTVVTTHNDVVDPDDGLISFREALSYAGTGGLGNEITFSLDVEHDYIVLNAPVVFEKNVSVRAVNQTTGRTIEFDPSISNENSPVYIVPEGKTVSFYSGTYRSGRDNEGGLFNNSGELKLEHVEFYYTMGTYGAAVYNTGTVSIDSCNFTYCRANADGGAIYNLGTLRARDTAFVECSAIGDGGVVYNEGLFVVQNCTASTSFAGDKDGWETDFNGIGSPSSGRGGFLFNRGLAVINGGSFLDSIAALGGCVFWNASEGLLRVNNVAVGNYRNSWMGDETGGYVYGFDTESVFNESGGDLVLVNSSFFKARYLDEPGYVKNYVNLDGTPSRALVMNCAFDLPRVSAVAGNATIRGCAFSENSFPVYAVATNKYDDEVVDIRLRRAGKQSQLCVVPVQTLAQSYPGVLLRNNANALEWKDGGSWTRAGVDLVDLDNASLTCDLFGDERATVAGGLVFPGVTATFSPPEALDTVVTTAEDIVNPNDGLISLREATEYSRYMGGLSWESYPDVSFAPELGGQNIYIDHGPIICETVDESFYMNGPEESTVNLVVRNGGGALVITNSGWVTLYKINIMNASATGNGGAICCTAPATFFVTDCCFSNCVATGSGGAIYCLGGGQFSKCNFIDCRSSGDGGGIFARGETGMMNVAFVNCSAAGRGGGACLEDYTFFYCTSVDYCTADTGGGAWFGTGEIHSSRFGNCSASYRGGAVYGGDCEILKCTFIADSAPDGAAAWFSEGNRHAVVSTCTIVDCTASEGGAVFVSNRPLSLANCSELNCLSGTGHLFAAGKDGARVVALNCLLPDQPDDGSVVTFGTSLLAFHDSLEDGYFIDPDYGLPRRYHFYGGGANNGMPFYENPFLHVAIQPSGSAGTLVGYFTVDDDIRLAYYIGNAQWLDEYGETPTEYVTRYSSDLNEANRGNVPESYGCGALIGSGVQDTKSMVVTTLKDVSDDYDGRISLREAINNAIYCSQYPYYRQYSDCRVTFAIAETTDPVIFFTNKISRITDENYFQNGCRLIIDGALPDGRRMRIDLGGKNAFLRVASGNAVTLRNLEIVNGNSGSDPSSYELATVDCAGFDEEPLIIENCLFDNCSSSQDSGQSVVLARTGNAEIKQTVFQNNSALERVAYVYEGRLTADSCLFVSNSVNNNVVFARKADIDSCVFQGNALLSNSQNLLNISGDSTYGSDTIVSSSFLDNSLRGGFAVGAVGTLDIANVTSGGSIDGSFITPGAGGTVRIINSIVADTLCPNAASARVKTEGSFLNSVGESVKRNIGGIEFTSYTASGNANPGTATGFYVADGQRRICRFAGGLWVGVGGNHVDSDAVAVFGKDLFGGSRLLGGAGYPYYTCGALSDNAVELVVTTVADIVNESDGVVSLREAIAAAEAGMTRIDGRRRITFSIAGNRNPVIAPSSAIVVSNSTVFTADYPLEIDGANGRGRVTFDGQNTKRLFRIDGLTGVSFSNCTFTRGCGDLGGAIYTDGPTTLSSVTFANCTASNMGGAIFGLDVEAEDCIFTNCVSANSGGAVYIDYEKGWKMQFMASNCAFLDNQAGGSGAGGAVCARADAAVYIDRSSFIGNKATDGSAVYLGSSSTSEIVNSTFANNESCWIDSGTIYERGSELLLVHVTSWGNTCLEGSPIFVGSYLGYAYVHASLVGEVEADPDLADDVLALNGTVFGAAPTRFDCPHGHPELTVVQIRGVPQYYLKPSSSAIFAGEALEDVDQLGSLRTAGSPTLGAIDYAAIPQGDEPGQDEPEITHPDLIAYCDLDDVYIWVEAKGLDVDDVNESEFALASYLLNTPLQTAAPELTITGISQNNAGKWQVKVHAGAYYGGALHAVILGEGSTPAINGKLTLSVTQTLAGPWSTQTYNQSNIAYDATGDATVTAQSGSFYKAVILP